MKQAAMLCTMILLGVSAGTAAASGSFADLESIERSFVQLANEVSPVVVSIETRIDPANRTPDAHPMVGSGVVIGSDGLILTNDHVIRHADRIQVVLYGGNRHIAQVVARDERSDLAVIHVDATGLATVRYSDLGHVRVGQWALALGNPFGIATNGSPSMSYGIVSSLGRSLRQLEDDGRKYYGNLIETTADINPGNSGGPLFNIRGELIGINTAIETTSGVSEGLGFAIPISSRTRRIIDTLARGDAVEYGFLGVNIRDRSASFLTPTPDGIGQAVLVTRVESGSPAERAGIETDDLIVAYRSMPVEDSDHLIRLIGSTPVGEVVPMRIYRGSRPMMLDVVIGNRDLVLVGSEPQN